MARALHFVFKVGDRNATAHFYRQVLMMKFLRHEEFSEGCLASCNGPYNGKWSKSMVGYGPEISHFVIELTYNYGIGQYLAGNDFQGVHVKSKNIYENVCNKKIEHSVISSNCILIKSPDGHSFFIYNEDNEGDPIFRVTLSSSNLARTTEYWQQNLQLSLFNSNSVKKSVEFCFKPKQCHLEFVDIGQAVEHAKAYGRIAFACPRCQLQSIQERVSKAGFTILKPLVSLDTPGKATVEVVIMADPDGHEICFVGDEAFQELSQVDPEAEKLLDLAMEADKSSEWFAKHGGKASA